MSWGMSPIMKETFYRNTDGTKSPEEYFGIDVRVMDFSLQPANLSDYAEYFEEYLDNPRFSINPYGVGAITSEHTDFHFTHMISPLRNAQTINEFIDYKLPDITDERCFSQVAGEIVKVQQNGIAAVGPEDLSIFELAWYIRGYEEFMMDLLINPDFADCLLDRILDMRITIAKKYVDMGIDVITGGDDVACQRGLLMKHETFLKHLKPRYQKLIEEIKGMKQDTLFFFHTDGKAHDVIEDLIDVGVDILNPCQPECNDLKEIKRNYGDKLAFWGAIGIQRLLPFGTPDEIRLEVKSLIETLGGGGGILLGPTHVIEPEVPWENLVALYGAIDEFGAY